MSDILPPTDPSLAPTSATQIGPLRPRFGVSEGGMPGGKFLPGPTGNEMADQWFDEWQQRTLGRSIDTGDARLMHELAKTFAGERIPGMPVTVPIPQEIDVHFRGIDKGQIDLDPIMALKHGFAASPMGAIQRWASMEAPQFTSDPNYDHWSDPAIKESRFKDQPHLFELSQSQEQSRWIMRYMERHEKEARQLEAMTGGAGIFEMAGSVLGDPLTYAPATLGVRAGKLAARATHLTSPGTVALGFKPVVWGGLQDGLRAASMQAAVALIDAGLHRSLDSTATHGSIADIVALPSAIAGAVGFLSSSYTRFGIGMDALKRAHGDEAFLAGTRIKAARTAGVGPAAPGVLSEAEEVYWVAAAAKNPDGRFHVDGMVLGYDGKNVLFRTSEGLEVEIPALKVDQVSAGKGSRGIVVSSDMLAGNKALQASAMNLDGPFVGGNYTASLVNQLDATVRPGALATDYAAMRLDELDKGGIGAAGLTKRAPVPRRLIDMEFKPGELPEVIEVRPGVWVDRLEYRKMINTEFKPGELPETIEAAPGVWITRAEHQKLINTEFKPGELPEMFEVAPGRYMERAQYHKLINTEFKPGQLLPASLDDVNISRGSLSAAADEAGGMSGIHSRKAMLEANRLVATGIGIEKLPFDVVNRASSSPFTTWQTTVQDMLALGGRVHVRNTAAGGYVANAIPVETLIKTEWMKPTYDVVRAIRDEWQLARAGHAPVDPSDLQRIGFELKTTFNDWRGKTKGISFEDFRRRVGDATINGDKDLLSDNYTPQINASAARTRQLWERIKNEGDEVGIFKEAHQEQVAKAEARLAAAKKANNSGDSVLAAEKHLEHVKALLHDVITGGPKVTTAKSYRPRIWLQDQLRDRADEFKAIIDKWLREANPNLGPKERATAADNIHETLTRDRPIWSKKEVDQHFNDLADPSSAKARTLMIPDMLVRDFLENDIEALVRHHSRVMGTGIEMHRRFGSTGMEAEIGEIWNEAKLLFNTTTDNAVRKQIIKRRDLDIADLEASRDRLYGHYGAPEDPHRWQSRTIRMAKQFTNLTVLGMSGVTALGDLVRPLMTEGLQAMNDYGFRSLASESRAQILKLSRKELELAGDAMELIANTRALSMSDTGDMFRSRSTFERGLSKANSWFFVANGLNAVNQLDKEWAGLVIQGNVNRALKNLTGPNPERVPEWMKVRLAANGIDEPMALRIADQMRKGGQNNFGKLLLADTLKWTDDEAVKVYRTALNQMVNRTVPTPTLADTPNWMSSELGGLMMQYKAFSFGALNRTLLSGLQEDGRKFWYSATAMVGFALILNEMRSRLFYDRSTFDKPMTGVLMDAVDRSSILGWFSDANRATEILTGHRAGIRPLVGAEKPRNDPTDRVIGTALGPAAGQGVNALSVLGDFLSMHPTVKTMADARKMIPGQNIPYLDPAFDRLISDGSWYPKKQTKEEKAAARDRPRWQGDLAGRMDSYAEAEAYEARQAAKVNRRRKGEQENGQP